MALSAKSTASFGHSAAEFARDQAIREWRQNSQSMMAFRKGSYSFNIASCENQTSELEIEDDYFNKMSASEFLPEMAGAGENGTLPDSQTSTENEPRLSLIEEFLPYFKKKTIENELRGYLRLEEGWDGVNSVAPPESAVEDAISFLCRFSGALTQPSPMVASDGEVGLYWRYGTAYVELEFAGDGMMFGYGRDLNGKEAFIDDIPVNSTKEMEKAISTVTKIVVEFPQDDDQDG